MAFSLPRTTLLRDLKILTKYSADITASVQNDSRKTSRAKTIVARVVRKEVHKVEYITLGCSDFVCEKERWVIPNVH